MDMKTLEELQQPDDRSLFFSPWGLGGKLNAEDAAAYQQEVIGRFDLVPQVSESVRDLFERIREVYSSGVLNYGFYTVAHDLAHSAVEHALRERFVEFYSGRAVTLLDRQGVENQIQVTRYGEFHKEIRRRRLRKLRLRAGQEITFDGMLKSLIEWARAEGLLRGQRNRHHERLLVKIRNFITHEAGYHLLTPPDAATAIGDLAEIINLLWGSPTPGGRLYPAPVEREIMAVGWSPSGDMVIQGSAEYLNAIPAEQEPDHLTYVLVRAWPHDGGLAHFDALYEVTTYPCELLWGPGSRQDALTWLEQEQPTGDEAEVLDRQFLVRFHKQRLYLPQQLDIVAGLQGEEREGTWFLMQTDSPLDVFNHLRQMLAGASTHSHIGPCSECPVEIISHGSWQEGMDRLAAMGASVTPRTAPDVRVKSYYPRWNEIGNGGWSLPAHAQSMP